MAAKDLTVGSIPLLVVKLSLPVLGYFGLQSLYALADLYFVGRLGGAAVAGLGISLNIFFLILALGMSLGIGALALISQAYGAGRRNQVAPMFQQTCWMVLIAGIAGWMLAWLATDRYFAFFTADPVVHAQGAAYFRIYAATFLTQLCLMVFGFTWRAVGDFVTPAVLMALSVTANIVLDPLLIFGLGPFPRLEMRGAALATVLSQVLPLGVYLWLIFRSRRNDILVLRRPFLLDGGRMVRMLRIGVPSGLQMFLMAAGLILTYRVVRPFGGDASAAVGVGFRVVQSAFLPAVAIGAAVSSLAGQNYGSRDFGRVKAALLWGMGFVGAIIVSEYALLLWKPALWVSFFAEERAVIAIGADYLVIAGLMLPFHAISHVITAGAQGLGRTLYPLLTQALQFGVYLGALAVLVYALRGGVTGAFWSAAISYVVEFFVMMAVLVYFWRSVLKGPATGFPGRAAGVAPTRAS